MKASTHKKIRYAVVGQGHIAQVAVLPGFQHAKKNSELVALVSGDATKLRALGKKYKIKGLYTYDDYDDLLVSGEIDAVYLALPNDLHADFANRAFRAGIHVLCEKPLAVTGHECEEMITVAREHRVKLMTAYRLHFEIGNLSAIEALKKKKIGDPVIFNSVFTIAEDKKNYRAGPRAIGGGPTYDVGIYCLNAARYLFQSEPIEVSAMALGAIRPQDSDSEETMAVTLRFDGNRVANFVCSFGAFPSGSFQVVGKKGVLELQNAYEYVESKTMKITTKSSSAQKKFGARDQFGAELVYFSECILKNREPEPSGIEGLADVRIIEAIFEAANTGRTIALQPIEKSYPGLTQEIHLPPVAEPELVKTKSASKDEAA